MAGAGRGARRFVPAARWAGFVSERQIELLPYCKHRVSQLRNQPSVMRGGRGYPQSLGASWNGWIVDRLDVDPVPFKQQVARPLAKIGISDHDRHDMRFRRHHRKAGFPESRLGLSYGGALARALHTGCLAMGDRGCRSRRHRGRQGRREDKSGCVGSDGVHDSTRPGDVATESAIGLGERSLHDVNARHNAIALGHTCAAWPVHANRVYLVEVSHCAIALGKVADCLEGSNVAVHRIDALEDDQLWASGRCSREQLLEMLKVIVAPDLPGTARGAHAFNHRIVIVSVGQDQAIWEESGDRRNTRVVGHIAGSENEGRLLAMQVRKLGLQLYNSPIRT